MGLVVLVAGLAMLVAAALPSRPGHRVRPGATGALMTAGLLLVGEPIVSQRIDGAYPVLLVAASLALVPFAWVNRAIPGMVLACAGVALNATVVGFNGAMPIESSAVARAGLDPALVPYPSDPRFEPADDETSLRWLGARIAVPIPGAREVDSLGDVATAAGIGLFLVGYARRHRRELPSDYVRMAGWAQDRHPERC
ncbi:MAG: DUF5317 family protein [Sporichthyaceae bacterium]